MGKKVFSVLFISISFVLLVYLYPVWERSPGGMWIPFFYLLTVILFVWMVVKTIQEIVRLVRLFRRRRAPLSTHYLSLVILESFLFLGLFNPFKVNSEDVYGKVIFRACYEGTQNQATLQLRENNYFEIHWTGAFFYDEYFTGSYTQSGDTLFLNYNGKRPVRFGDKIYMDDRKDLLVTIREENDGLQNVVLFYYGYCEGLN